MNLCSLFTASVAPFEGLKTDGDGILRGSTLFPDWNEKDEKENKHLREFWDQLYGVCQLLVSQSLVSQSGRSSD